MAAFASEVFTRRGERCRGYNYCDQRKALVASCCDDGLGSGPRVPFLNLFLSLYLSFRTRIHCSEVVFSRKAMNVAGGVFTNVFKLPLRVVVRVAG